MENGCIVNVGARIDLRVGWSYTSNLNLTHVAPGLPKLPGCPRRAGSSHGHSPPSLTMVSGDHVATVRGDYVLRPAISSVRVVSPRIHITEYIIDIYGNCMYVFVSHWYITLFKYLYSTLPFPL